MASRKPNETLYYREIETAENCWASKRVASFLEAYQQTIVEFRHGIKTSIIYGNSQVAIRLSNHHDWRCPRQSWRVRDVSKHEFIDFELDSGAQFTVRHAADGLTNRTHIANIYLVKRQIYSDDIWVTLSEDIEILCHQREQLLLVLGSVGQWVDF